MSTDWQRFDARGCVATILTRSGLAGRGVQIETEVLLLLDLKDGEEVIVKIASLERTRELLPIFSPSRVRYFGAPHEAAELRGIASGVNSAAQFVREIEAGG